MKTNLDGHILSGQEVDRYSRHMLLDELGLAAQERLKRAKVLVIGAGGIGSGVIPHLAASGIGTIGIIDDDRVEITNLHRQVIHKTTNVGEAKVHEP